MDKGNIFFSVKSKNKYLFETIKNICGNQNGQCDGIYGMLNRILFIAIRDIVILIKVILLTVLFNRER